MREKSMMLAIKTLLSIGVIAVCFIVYTLVSPRCDDGTTGFSTHESAEECDAI